MKHTFFIPIVFFLLTGTLLQSQTVSIPPISVRAFVFDKKDSLLPLSTIILNKRTSTGQTSAPGVACLITGIKTDTFLVTSGGYEVRRICFADSITKESYTIRLALQIKTSNLTPVAIYPIKDLSQIQKERAAIGKAQTRQTVGIVDAASSPITYLYERFSRDGKSREAVAILENDDRKREILKELFRTYVRAGVIELEEDEFDSFINYLNIPEPFLRSATDFELATVIRQRYLQYRAAQQIHNRNQR